MSLARHGSNPSFQKHWAGTQKGFDMTNTINTGSTDMFDGIEDETDDQTPTFVKGTWQAILHNSEVKRALGAKNNKAASALLWQGAQAGIESWLPDSDTDVSAENLYNEAKLALGGEHRKGDASKIKTVAVAVKTKGLVLSLYPNLSRAYGEAKRLTSTVAQEAAEDAAADKAIEDLIATAPQSASTPENAAKIVLSAGLDEAARLLLDALGATNEAAHRSFMRAISQEIAGRLKPKATTVKAGPKAGATQAPTGGAAQKAAPHAVKAQPAKPKQAATKASPVKAGATASTKAKPVARPVAVKATEVAEPAKGEPIHEPVEAGHEHVDTPAVPVKKAVVKGRPVAVKRGA